MAYQARKRERFEEILELVDKKGNIVHSIRVQLDPDDIVIKLNRKYNALTRALANSKELQRKELSNTELEKSFEKLGRAVTDLFEAVFGKEDADTIVQFYDNRYIEMTQEVIPFITQCVIPRCAEINKRNQKLTLGKYTRNKRTFFGCR